MHTQFFGNFLLNKEIISPEQLIDLLKIHSTAHKKLGTLAIHSGYMSASEVEDVFITQTHYDKLFGELAIEMGYLTKEQVDELLTLQLPDYMLLGQTLIEQGVITHVELENLIKDCKEQNDGKPYLPYSMHLKRQLICINPSYDNVAEELRRLKGTKEKI